MNAYSRNRNNRDMNSEIVIAIVICGGLISSTYTSRYANNATVISANTEALVNNYNY